MKIIINLFLIAGLLITIGCGGAGINGNAPKVYEDVKAMKTDVKAGVEKIEIAAFKTLYESDEMFVLLDIREFDEFENGSIEGAMHLSRGLLEFKIADESFWDAEGMFAPEKTEKIIVFGSMIDRGAFAAETLGRLGYLNVKYIYGGYTAWVHGPEAIVEEEVKAVAEGCGA